MDHESKLAPGWPDSFRVVGRNFHPVAAEGLAFAGAPGWLGGFLHGWESFEDLTERLVLFGRVVSGCLGSGTRNVIIIYNHSISFTWFDCGLWCIRLFRIPVVGAQ